MKKEKNTYTCEKCQYSTNNKYDYNKHFLTKKHIKNMTENNQVYYCCEKCNKKYKTHSGMWKHTSRCKDDIIKEDEKTFSNREVIEMLQEIKNGQQPSTVNNTNNNTNNFNVQMYLNEHYKEGPNLIDLVNKMTIQPGYKHEFEAIGYDGIVCKMWREVLDEIPIKNRPIYCIKDEDPLQEILHIRDGNNWNKITELEWIKDIYDTENMSEENMTIIYKILNKLGERILEQIEQKYGKHGDFKHFRRRNNSEILYPPCIIGIINQIIMHIKMEKNTLN